MFPLTLNTLGTPVMPPVSPVGDTSYKPDLSLAGASSSPRTDSQSTEVQGKLADLDEVLRALRELQTGSAPLEPEKISVFLNKNSPLIPHNGSTEPGTNRLENVLKFYGIVPSRPHSLEQLRVTINAVESARSEISLGLDDKSSQGDALLQDRYDSKITGQVDQLEAKHKKPLLSYLCEGLSAQTLERASASPAAMLEQLVKSPRANELIQTLLIELGGPDGKLDGVISPAVKTRLLMKVITLSLDPPQSRKSGYVAGFHLASVEHWGSSYSQVNTSLRLHLTQTKKVSGAEADLAAYLLKPQFPVDFAVRDVPDELSYRSSTVWVNFKHGATLAEMIEPGSASRMSFQELVDLPGKLSEQAKTPEEWSAIAAARIPAILEWATTQGVISQKGEYSQAEIQRAVSAFDDHVGRIVQATEQMAKDVPMRKDYFERMEAGVSRTELLSLISPFFALYRHLSGEEIRPSDVGYQYPVYDEATFQAAFDEYLSKAKAGYGKVLNHQLSQLPLKDRVAIERGEVTLYALRTKPNGQDETDDEKKAARTRPGFIIKSVYAGETSYYEINPIKGIARRRDDLKPILESYDPAEKNYAKDFMSIDHSSDGVPSGEVVVRNSRTGRKAFKEQWEAFKAGKGPRPDSFTLVVPEQIGRFDASAPGNETAVPRTLSSERSNAVSTLITTDLFYVDEKQLQEWAQSDPSRESHAQKNDAAFWDRMKGFAQSFVPFWGGIEDIVNGNTKQGIISLTVDGLFTFAGPVGKFAAGSVRAFSNVGKVGIRALLPKFAPLIKQFSVSVVRNLNPLEPLTSGIKFNGGSLLKFQKGDMATIQRGIAKLRQSSAFKLPGKGRYEVNPQIPLTSRTVAPGRTIQVPEGFSSDQARVLTRHKHVDLVVGEDVFRYSPDKPGSLIKLGGPDDRGPLEGFLQTCVGMGKRGKRSTSLCYTKQIEPGGTPTFQDAQALEHRRLIPGVGSANSPRTVVHERRLYRVNEAGSEELLPIATVKPVTYRQQTTGSIVNEVDFGYDDFGTRRALNDDTVVVKMDAISDLSQDQRVLRGVKVEHDGRHYVVVEGDTGVHFYAELNGNGSLDFHRLNTHDPLDLAFIKLHDSYKDIHGFVAQGTPNNQLVVLPSLDTLVKKIIRDEPMSPAEVEHLGKVLKGLPPEKQREVLMSVYASGDNPGHVVVAAKPIRLEPIKKPTEFDQMVPSEQNRVLAEGGRKAVDDQFQATGIRSANQQVLGQPGELARNAHATDVVGWLYTRTGAPNYSEIVLKTGAGNCDQMAKVAVDTINASGGHARIAQVKGHTFGIIGGPPGQPSSKGFGEPEWADAWVVDPWAGITCPASQYPAQFKARMQEWSNEGRRILISDGGTPPRSVWSDPMEPRWIDATVKGDTQVF
ncbi:hypothetical protein [Pseudomonas reactans]|uniref:hypothetical protein n=1 Tax=Pseudomonas reactans TaxID=117680 RepID=UPI0015A0D93F|nr:hypothetical protein [Pseudomonas reactans]NWA70067.1 hypothetical protein [Pseudomonas reactans]